MKSHSPLPDLLRLVGMLAALAAYTGDWFGVRDAVTMVLAYAAAVIVGLAMLAGVLLSKWIQHGLPSSTSS